MIKIVLVELDLTAAPAGTVHRVCTASHDVVMNGYTFVGAGDLLKIDDIETTADLASIGTTITLSGIDPAYRQEIDRNGFKKAPITIYAGDIQDNTNQVINEVIIHAGTCDTPITEVDYSSGSMTIGVSTVSVWGDLEKTPNLSRSSYATHSSLHAYDADGNFVPDEIYKYVASTATEEEWIS